ncbi:MAG: UDP-N-acetylmuramoyl-tripeptide--D-alanyl-D-alanine ligase [Bacteroidales bacterium]|nr:UDP-N-acetylmuramoyl-tripeptide--D-alanyl-D-alanine ligase [Bacteroidales bacterium]MCF8456141.1 UDP-N-acetylmuramoyl-tripeptide--D-alanyl-D-alanine ligase [Bacteroidales bacterium]
MSIEQLYEHYLANPIISTDTRSIEKGSIFFALKGERFNGNLYANQALDNGASYVVVDELGASDHINAIYVEDCLICLQQLANYHRKQLKIPVLAITGTNGKTTSKELITSVLSKKFSVCATKGNLNNHIGVPLTLLSITNENEFAVVEMGANHLGEIGALCEIANPDYGLITNIGKAHLEGFGSFEGVISAKGELYEHIIKNKGKLFRNSNNPILHKLANGYPAMLYGEDTKSEVFGQITSAGPFLEMEFFDANEDILQPYSISTQLAGEYNFENVMAAIRIGIHFGVGKNQIVEAIENYQPKNNRSQILKTSTNTLVVDAYNANPSSMMSAIGNFQKMKAENKTLILGDMLELGSFSAEEHSKLLQSIKNFQWDRVLLVGPEFTKAAKGLALPCFSNVDELSKFLEKKGIFNSTILIKGSRGIRLEKVIGIL